MRSLWDAQSYPGEMWCHSIFTFGGIFSDLDAGSPQAYSNLAIRSGSCPEKYSLQALSSHAFWGSENLCSAGSTSGKLSPDESSLSPVAVLCLRDVRWAVSASLVIAVNII